MAVPFAAGAATMALLDNNKNPTTIINNTYIPLSEAQADLFMTTAEFKGQLETTCQSIYLYIDRHGYFKPKTLVNRSNGEKRIITLHQANVLIENEKKGKRISYKTILMTKGIGGLEKFTIPIEENRCSRIGWYVLCPWCIPCLIERDCKEGPNLQDGRARMTEVDQFHFNLLKI